MVQPGRAGSASATAAVISASGSAQNPIKPGQSYFRKAGVEHDVRNDTAREIVFVEIEIKRK